MLHVANVVAKQMALVIAASGGMLRNNPKAVAHRAVLDDCFKNLCTIGM